MPRNFNDDISVLTEDNKSMFRRSRSKSRSRRFMSGSSSVNGPATASSSQSVSAASLPATTSLKSNSFFGRSRNRSRSRPRNKNAPGTGSSSQSVSSSVGAASLPATATSASTPSLFGRNRSRSRSRPRRASQPTMQQQPGDPSSSSQSVSAASRSGSRPSSKRSISSIRKRFGLANSGRFKQADDISISDSLCSGVLRDAASMGDSVGSNNIGQSLGNSIGHSNRSAPPPAAPLPGGVADFNSQYNKKPTNESVGSNLTTSSGGPSLERSAQQWAPLGGSCNNNSFASSNAPSSLAMSSAMEDQMKREQRKERVKEKLDRYKRDQKQLKQACVAMEQQLAQTTEKLREVDTRAASKIDSLELELRETRVGMERVAKQSTREVTDQSECIKTLGKKLIRQAHVIKRQKAAVEQYKCQLEGLGEEMAMQDERDQRRDEETGELRERLDEAKEQKIKMQNMLQENIEEMMDLKSETERDAKNIRDLEFHLQQKEATLDRVVQEVSEKAVKISELEERLEEKDRELGEVNAKYKESENSVTVMQKELESASSEIEELRCKYASWKTTGSAGGDGAAGGSVAASGGGDRRASLASVGRSPSILGFGLNRGASARPLSFEEGEDPIETFEAELAAKDATIQTLDDNCKEHEETIKTLRSDMVKMSSTYKQDSYLKRKEIAKLKKQNAEYALKLRALEKAFKCVNATENMNVVGNKFHGHTTHGGRGGGGGGVGGVEGVSPRTSGSSVHGQTMHSVGSLSSKDDKAAAVKARLGLAPYEFPASSSAKDPLIVQQSNFFDGASDGGSDLGGKGENPEEC